MMPTNIIHNNNNTKNDKTRRRTRIKRSGRCDGQDQLRLTNMLELTA